MNRVALSLAETRAVFERQALLPVKDALDIVQEAQRAMDEEPNVARVRCPVSADGDAAVFVIGDLHGQFFDLMRLLDALGVGAGTELQERDVQLVFLGDYVDRGAFSCEVMLYLLLLKARHPTKVWLLRGNHECESISSFYGFRNECRVKYGISAYYHFLSCFQTMQVAALVHTSRGRIFCVHGGISPEISDVAAIDGLDRKCEVLTAGPLCDLLWSDPTASSSAPSDGSTRREQQAQQPGVSWHPNQERGCSFYFTARALFEFLARSDLLAVVRAHEFEEEGFMYHFDGPEFRELDQRSCRDLPPLMTVFSAPNYCDTHGNKGAYLVIRDQPFSWEMKQIVAAGHPAPPLASTERSADMWRQFNQTLPFLPASKEFFDEVVRLSSKQQCLFYREDERIPAFLRPRQADPELMPARSESPTPDSQVERKRRFTSEMHPHAIRRALDDEVHKWMQSDEGSMQVFPPSSDLIPQRSRVDASDASLASDDRSGILTQQELDMVKLMFSLMDTDGRLTLTADKVTRFVLNILGERISDQVANNYLRALDFDGNGTVDFSDVLSWVATIKTNYHRAIAREGESSAAIQVARVLVRVAWRWLHNRLSSLTSARRTCLWLTLVCLLRDLYTSKRHRLKSSPVLRLLGSITTMLYAISLLRAGKGPKSLLLGALAGIRGKQSKLPRPQ